MTDTELFFHSNTWHTRSGLFMRQTYLNKERMGRILDISQCLGCDDFLHCDKRYKEGDEIYVYFLKVLTPIKLNNYVNIFRPSMNKLI